MVNSSSSGSDSDSSSGSSSDSSSDSSESNEDDPCITNPSVAKKGSYRDSSGNKIICPPSDTTTESPETSTTIPADTNNLCVADEPFLGCNDDELCIIVNTQTPATCLSDDIPADQLICGVEAGPCCPIEQPNGSLGRECEPVEGGTLQCFTQVTPTVQDAFGQAGICVFVQNDGNVQCGIDVDGRACCPSNVAAQECQAGLQCTIIDNLNSRVAQCIPPPNQAMENDEVNDGVSHNVRSMNDGKDVNGDIVISSIVVIVSLFAIAAIIGIWWFYKRNVKNRGHAKIENIDMDEDEDAIGDENEMSLTTDVIQETESLD